jgi:serine/threonine protein kinase
VDFGLSTLMRATQLPLISLRPSPYPGGSLQWKAPELLDYDPDGPQEQDLNTPEIDIYAFGCVSYEVGLICSHVSNDLPCE